LDKHGVAKHASKTAAREEAKVMSVVLAIFNWPV
jgi:hypothetical protein